MLTASINPIPFLSFSPQKSIILSSEALTFLSSLGSQPLHIITVAGKYRTGKSYILNRVLLQQKSGKGFQVGPTINACTKGLWIWPEVVQIGEKSCLIIDTQGLGSLQQGQNTDIKIFLMAALLSSYLIYNSVGSIDEKAIESLSLVINLAHLLNKSSPFDSQDLISSFPSFLWLLRDFSLRLEDQNGESITPKDYLENALRYQKGTSKATERKNQIRKEFKSFFKERDCFALIRPTKDESDLQILNKLPQKQLRPEFVKLIHQLRHKISLQAPPKRLRNKPITPSTFISLIQHYIKAINEGALPSISSHWDSLCQTQSSRILALCELIYKEKLQQSQEESTEWLRQKHVEAVMEGSRIVENSFLSKIQKQLIKEKVTRLFEQMFTKISGDLQQQRHKHAKALIQQQIQQLQLQQAKPNLEVMTQFIAIMEKIRVEHEQFDPLIYQPLYESAISFLGSLLEQSVSSLSSQIDEKIAKIEWMEKLNEEREKKEKDIQQMARLEIDRLKNQIERVRSETKIKQHNDSQSHTIIERLKQENRNFIDQNQSLQRRIIKLEEQLTDSTQKLSNKSLSFSEIDGKCHSFQVQLLKTSQQLKQQSIKCRKLLRQKQIIKHRYEQYQQQNLLMRAKIQQMQSIIQKQQTQMKKEKRNTIINTEITSEMKQMISKTEMKQMISKTEEMEYKLKELESQRNNLTHQLKQQRQTNEALMLAPQNLHFQALKRDNQLHKSTNLQLTKQLNQLSTIHTLYCEFKCSLCQSIIPRSLSTEHVQHCPISLSSLSFSVSYAYDMDKIKFIIEVEYGQKQWQVTKSWQAIRMLLDRAGLGSNQMFFSENSQISDEERRVELEQILNQSIKSKIWGDVFFVQYFAIDLHFAKQQSTKNKGKRVPLQLRQIQEDIPINQSVQMMKTSKFTKKTFKFG